MRNKSREEQRHLESYNTTALNVSVTCTEQTMRSTQVDRHTIIRSYNGSDLSISVRPALYGDNKITAFNTTITTFSTLFGDTETCYLRKLLPSQCFSEENCSSITNVGRKVPNPSGTKIYCLNSTEVLGNRTLIISLADVPCAILYVQNVSEISYINASFIRCSRQNSYALKQKHAHQYSENSPFNCTSGLSFAKSTAAILISVISI